MSNSTKYMTKHFMEYRYSPCPVCNHYGWDTHTGEETEIRCHRLMLSDLKEKGEENLNQLTRTLENGKTYHVVQEKNTKQTAIHFTETSVDGIDASVVYAHVPAKYKQFILEKITDPDLLDRYYQRVFEAIALAKSDMPILNAVWQGLTLQQAQSLGLSVADKNAILQYLLQYYTEQELVDYPGIYSRNGKVSFDYTTGIVLPYQNVHGTYTSVSIRRTTEYKGNRYKVLSGSRESFYGLVNPTVENTGKTLLITEGLVKAQIATDYFGCVAGIGLTSFNNWTQIVPEIMYLIEKEGIKRVIVAFDQDEDPKTKNRVKKSEQSLSEELYALGHRTGQHRFEIVNARWTNAKGIDDAINFGEKIQIVPFSTSKKVVLSESGRNYMTYIRAQEYAKHHENDKDTASEARKEIKKIVTEAILADKIEGLKVLASEAGSGKTHITIDELFDIWSELGRIDGGNHRSVVFFKTHDLLQQTLAKLPEQFSEKVFVYRARNEENCSQFTEVKPYQDREQAIYRNVCSVCPFKSDCETIQGKYFNQFEDARNRNIIFSVQQSANFVLLGTDEQTSKFGGFTHIFVDEMMPIDREFLFSSDELEILDNQVVAEIEHGDVLNNSDGELQSIRNVFAGLREVLKQVQAEHKPHFRIYASETVQRLIEKGLSKEEIQKACDVVASRTIGRGEVKGIDVEVYGTQISRFGSAYIFEALRSELSGEPSSVVLTLEKPYNMASIRLVRPEKELIKRLSEGALILDARPNKGILSVFDQVDVKTIRVRPNDKLRTNLGLGFHTTSKHIKKAGSEKILTEFCKEKGIEMTEDTGMNLQKEWHDRLVGKPEMSEVVMGYYGKDDFGTRKYESVKKYVLQSPRINLNAAQSRFEALKGRKVNQSSRTDYVYDHNGNMIPKTVKDDDEFLEFYFGLLESALYQALNRLRQAIRNEEMEIYYIGEVSLWGGDLPIFDSVEYYTPESTKEKMKPKWAKNLSEQHEKQTVSKQNNMNEVIQATVKVLPQVGVEPEAGAEKIVRLLKDFGYWKLAKQIKEVSGLEIDENTIYRYFKDEEFIELLKAYLAESLRKHEKVDVVERMAKMIIELDGFGEPEPKPIGKEKRFEVDDDDDLEHLFDE